MALSKAELGTPTSLPTSVPPTAQAGGYWLVSGDALPQTEMSLRRGHIYVAGRLRKDSTRGICFSRKMTGRRKTIKSEDRSFYRHKSLFSKEKWGPGI